MLQAYANWSEFFDSFVAGHAHGGSWFDINLYWWSRRQDENVLFLKYEDLKKDLAGGIVEIATFLGCTIPEGGLEKVVNHCSFDSMKKNPKTNYEDKVFINKEISKFMRKGTIGDWKNYFTVAQNEVFDKLYEDKLKGSGLVFDFEL
ncbi:sulfotransferase 1C2-like [Anneissia japonica]|uniref:sulfotransferase 1C2-like n=1 Tax=Anneissia japonica TaxID=1529436 RepID=UPI0014258E89|nr:sulfotransferase 1C2-like [Anneissia japonica]